MSPGEFADERLREEIATVSEVAGSGQDCPTPETLWLSGRDDLDPTENETVILHMASCTACATAWKIARELAPRPAVSRFVTGKRRAPADRWMQFAAAAVIVLAVGASAFLLWPPQRDETPVYREQRDSRLFSAVDEDEPLARERFVLRWSGGPEGASYDVLITDERLETVDRVVSLDQPRYQVPEAALANLKSGDRLFWQVTALLPDGRRIESDSYIAIIR